MSVDQVRREKLKKKTKKEGGGISFSSPKREKSECHFLNQSLSLILYHFYFKILLCFMAEFPRFMD